MCGIVGIINFNNENGKDASCTETTIFLMTELLQLTQPRGEKATGVATLFSDCNYMLLKNEGTANKFINTFGNTEKDYEGYTTIMRNSDVNPIVSLGHCRKPSTGGNATPSDNKNNHPIKVDDIIGVHNGTLKNHKEIFKNLACDRDGLVDSEAIFRLVSHHTDNGKQLFTIENIKEICKYIVGEYSVLTFSGNNPHQVAAFRDGRPMELALIKPIGLLLIASEKKFLETAIARYTKATYIYKHPDYVRLRAKDVEFTDTIDKHLYIFDRTLTITNSTKISDLIISEKIPYNKEWQVPNVGNNNIIYNEYNGSYEYNNLFDGGIYGVNRHYHHAGNYNSISNTKRNQKRKQALVGMLWKNNIYTSTFNIEDIKELGSIIVSSNGNVQDLLDILDDNNEAEFNVNDSNTMAIIQTETKPIDNLIGDTAKIIDHSNTITEHNTKFEKEEITIDMDKNILAKAIEYSSKNTPVHNTLDEFTATTKIKPTGNLLTAFNQLAEFYAIKAYYDGYTAAAADITNSSNNSSEDIYNSRLKQYQAKNKSSRAKIRNLKKMLLLVSNVINDDIDVEDVININDTKYIDAAILESVLKAGDFRKFPILKSLTTIIKKVNG